MTLAASEASMADVPHASIPFRFGRRRPVSVALDPADFGTAFGLEMSLERATAQPPHDADPPGWLERLGLRLPRS